MNENETLVERIGATIREEEDNFIIESILPFCRSEQKISKEELKAAIKAYYGKDVVEVVRCKDCKYYEVSPTLAPSRFCFRIHGKDGKPVLFYASAYDFCSWGEKKYKEEK